MPKIINVDLEDKYRTLLTDVLPYELPLWYDNYTMYKAFHEREALYTTISGCDRQKLGVSSIPLNYVVSRGAGKFRNLSIIHPITQLKICDFYHNFSDLIEYYCSKSNQSLRHPVAKTTKFFGKLLSQELKDGVGVESINEDRITSSSYFRYSKFPFLYSFFESYDYHKLEKRFSHMMQADISKCFPSIYTHSIGWATKNKRLAKQKPHGSFEGNFDSLMQCTNYKETNGIIIGPEVSRIFAEIILQQIDLDLIDKLKTQKSFGDDGLVLGKDYDFRRYVDDYFIFYRDENVRDEILIQLQKCLFEYKLYLNEAKTTYNKRPFATEISLAKNSLNETIKSLYQSRFKENGEIVSLQQPSWKSNKSISTLKMAIAAYDVQYSSISNYLFSSLEKKMKSYLYILSGLEELQIEHLNWLLVDLDVLFFVHAMDIRIRTTDKVARTVSEVLKSSVNWNPHYQKLIYQKVFDMVIQAIDVFNDSLRGIIGLETLNLLGIMTMLPSNYQLKLKPQLLKSYYNKVRQSSNSQEFYFSWVSFMLFVRDKTPYHVFKYELIDDAKKFLLEHPDGFESTEFFLLYFDFMSCPNIHESTKLFLGEEIKKLTKVSYRSDRIKQIINNDFLVSWRDDDYLENSLRKREFVFSYE
jgi:hypothetical protein